MEFIALAVIMLLLLASVDAQAWPQRPPAGRRPRPWAPRRYIPRRRVQRSALLARPILGFGRLRRGVAAGPRWWWE